MEQQAELDFVAPHNMTQIGHTDPLVPREAVPRLGGQNGLVLEALMRGSATNIELEEFSGSRRINSRVADCRKWLKIHQHQTIVAHAEDTAAGIYRYQIVNMQHEQGETQ